MHVCTNDDDSKNGDNNNNNNNNISTIITSTRTKETYDEVCNEDTNVCVSGVFPVVLMCVIRIPMYVYLVCLQLS